MPESDASANALAPDLLDLLVCPLTRSALTQDGDHLVATQPAGAGLRYPIRDGIPVMLIDQAVLPEGVADLAAFKTRVRARPSPHRVEPGRSVLVTTAFGPGRVAFDPHGLKAVAPDAVADPGILTQQAVRESAGRVHGPGA